MSYKFYFTEEDNSRFHKTDFLAKYGILYDLLEDLVMNKTNINNANADQISLTVNLLQGYHKNDLFSKKIKISMKQKNRRRKKKSR